MKNLSRVIYIIIETIILTLIIACFIIFHIHIKAEHGSISLFERIHIYIEFHNLYEKDYNFDKVFVGYNGDYIGDENKKRPFIYLNIVFFILSLAGFILYILAITYYIVKAYHILNTIVYSLVLFTITGKAVLIR